MNAIVAARRLLALLGVGLLSGSVLVGCGGSPPIPPLTAGLDRVFVEHGFNGSVLVARDGTILLDKGYGVADRDRRVPNRPDTIFQIASLTKQFTAMAVLLLQEQGRLSVQDRVCDYLVECPPAWRTITIHQLLTHTAGIPEIQSVPGFDMTKPSTLAAQVTLLQSRPLDFTPGEKSQYSNSGYLVLGMLIERVSGLSYGAFVRDAILTPLGLGRTTYDLTPSPSRDRAVGYLDVDNPRGQVPIPDLSIAGPAVGLSSTVNDLYRWDRALFGGTFASSTSRRQMFTPHVPTCSPSDAVPCPETASASYGYSWVIGHEPSGRAFVMHPGAIPGAFGALNEYFPDQRVTMILLSNSWSGWSNFMNSSAPLVLESILFQANPSAGQT